MLFNKQISVEGVSYRTVAYQLIHATEGTEGDPLKLISADKISGDVSCDEALLHTAIS